MNLKEAENLKEQLEEKKEQYDQNKAKYDLYIQTLKEKFNCKTIEEGEKLYKQKIKEKETLDNEINEWEEDFITRLEESKILEDE